MIPLGLLAMLATALLAAGCGGGTAAQTPTAAAKKGPHTRAWRMVEVRGVATRFAKAFGGGDMKRACPYFSRALFQKMPGDPSGCPYDFAEGPSRWERSFLGAKVERISLSRDGAFAALSNGSIIRFRQSQGKWLVADLGGAEN